MPTALGSAIDFLQNFGFFDVILPFLLVFTIVFGILEKTKIFGVEKVGDKEYPKKSINSMIAFVIAFFVIAAREIVQAIQVSLPQVVFVLIILISFMMLAGSFMADKQFSFENRKGWIIFLTLMIFVSVIMIFMNSVGWLTPIIDYMLSDGSTIIPYIVFLAVIVMTVMYVVGRGKGDKEEKS